LVTNLEDMNNNQNDTLVENNVGRFVRYTAYGPECDQS